MRLMTRRYVGGILYVALLATSGLAHAQSSAASSVEANRLFVEAVMLYRQATALPATEAADRLNQVRRLFDRILVNHPDSLPGQAIRDGGSPGGVDLTVLPPTPPANWNDGKRGIARDLLNAYRGKLEELERVADATEYALLAWAAYGDKEVIDSLSEAGWHEHPRSRDNHFVEPSTLGGGDAVARLFVSDRGGAVLAFRGTTTKKDWLTNAGTVLPIYSDQLRSARVLADRALALYQDVTFVGHSLGGAMAQVARLHTGQVALIFNSAPMGLHELGMAISGEPLVREVNSALLAFRSPEDPVREVSEGISGFEDLVVRNVTLTSNTVFRNVLDGIAGTGHAHAIPVLAEAMAQVALARDERWLYAYLLEQSGLVVRNAESPGASDAVVAEGAAQTAEIVVKFPVESCSPRMVSACSICDPVQLGLFELGFLSPTKSHSNLRLDWGGVCNYKYDLFGGDSRARARDIMLNLFRTHQIEVLSVTEDEGYAPGHMKWIFEISEKDFRSDIWPLLGSIGASTGFIPSLGGQVGGKMAPAIEVFSAPHLVGAIDGAGVLTAYDGDTPYFRIEANKINGLNFERGMPVFAVPSNDVELRTATRSKIQEPNECPDQYFMNMYVITKDGLPLHIDPIANAIIRHAHGRILKNCKSFKDIQYRGYLVTRSAVKQAGGFEKFVSMTRGGSMPSSYLSCEGHLLEEHVCSTRRYNYFKRNHIGSLKKTYDDGIAAAKRKRAEREQEERNRAEEQRMNQVRSLYQEAETRWNEKMKDVVSSKAPWSNVADVIRYDRPLAIQRLAQGQKISLKVNKIQFNQGVASVNGNHVLTDYYEGLPPLETGWDAFFTDLQKATDTRGYMVSCRIDLDKVSKIKEGEIYSFDARLLNLSDVGGTGGFLLGRVDLECR